MRVHLPALRRIGLVAGIVMVAGISGVSSQTETPDSDKLALDVGNAMKANQQAISKFSWRVKSNLTMEGESKATVLNEMRFNTDGKLEITNIGGESSVEKKRGVRGRRQDQKIEDFSEYLAGVLDHSFKYIFMSKGTLVDVFDRAEIVQGEGGPTATAANVFVKGDDLFMAIDSASNLANKLKFNTTLGEDKISGVVSFAQIEGGPYKPVKLEIDIPTQAIKISAETYDWVQQQ